MAYSDFTLDRVTKTFELSISDQLGMFSSVPELESSLFLTETLRETLPLALASNTEKSRSELIIAPILVELRKQLQYQISWFSGIDFTVDSEKGLNGSCDFLISDSPELLIVKSPIIVIVEAKKENINAALGQCVAEMVAARIFNERQGNEVEAIHGTVTTGSIWQFLKLEGQVIKVDLSEYYLTGLKQ